MNNFQFNTPITMKYILNLSLVLTIIMASCQKEEPIQTVDQEESQKSPFDEFIDADVAIYTDEYHYQIDEEITMNFINQGYPEILWHGRCDNYNVIFNNLYESVNNEWIVKGQPSFCTYLGPSNNMPLPGPGNDLNYKFKLSEAGCYKFDYIFIGDQTQDSLIFESNAFFIID